MKLNDHRYHRYHGSSIYPCGCNKEHNPGYRWYVQTFHKRTRMPYSEKDSPHFRTLAEAKTAIHTAL